MARIKEIKAREILDSRGNPTIEATVILNDNTFSSASVPSGASVGSYEALELRDQDPNRYHGMGVLKAVSNINSIIAPALVNLDPLKQERIDEILISLDGTKNKTRLGANSLLAVSLATARSVSESQNIPLYKYINQMSNLSSPPTSIEKMPAPTFNLINGGQHGYGNLDFQEFHVVPSLKLPYHQSLEIGAEVYQALKKVLEYRGAVHSIGDEGGFAPNLFTNTDAIDTLVEAVAASHYKINTDVFISLDVAATNFFKDGKYTVKDRSQPFSSEEFITFYQKLIRNYELISLEDPLAEDDWSGWSILNGMLRGQTIIVGDDLTATNPERLKTAISKNAISAILIKPNQIGTLTETLGVIKQGREANLKIIVSHRSGETNDTFIADLAVGVCSDFMKFGAPARGERIAKYNRLLTIEQELDLK